MAKKKEDGGEPGFLDTIKETAKDFIKTKAIDMGKNVIHIIETKIDEKVAQIKKEITVAIVSSIMMMAGVLMILATIPFIIEHFFKLEVYFSFFVLGLIIVIFSLIYGKTGKKLPAKNP